MMTTEPVPHPAKFSGSIIMALRDRIIAPHPSIEVMRVLDPMAGVGTIHQLAVPGKVETVGLEIEPEWASQHPDTIEGDATDMPFSNNYFDVVCFSPPYGNRMADQFISLDGTKRITYYHFLGRRLDERSAAGMHWGDEYRDTMRKVLIESNRVVKPIGRIILNVSDFIQAGRVVPVVEWYIDTMVGMGYRVTDDVAVQTQRMKYGANHKLRVECERVLTFKLRRF